jgi:hypothetical protein
MNNRSRRLYELLQDGPDGWAKARYVTGVDESMKERHRRLIEDARLLAQVLHWETEAKIRAEARKILPQVKAEIKEVRRFLRQNLRDWKDQWILRAEWAECTRQCWSAHSDFDDDDGYIECECRCVGEFHGLLWVAKLVTA